MKQFTVKKILNVLIIKVKLYTQLIIRQWGCINFIATYMYITFYSWNIYIAQCIQITV